MLVLSRKLGEAVRIGGGVSITIVKITGGGVRLGIDAPDGMEIVREELLASLAEQKDTAEQFEAVESE